MTAAAIASLLAGLILFSMFRFGEWTARHVEVPAWGVLLLMLAVAPFHRFSFLGLAAAWAVGRTYGLRYDSQARKVYRKDVARMRAALRDGELVTHFQPIVDMTTGRTIGAEALCRWNHPSGMRYPGPWLDTLLGEEMLGEFSRWQAGEVVGVARRVPGVRFNWNVPPNLLSSLCLADEVLSYLKTFDVRTPQVCIEITEKMLLEDSAPLRANLRALGDAGVKIALDDFGSGAASVKNLLDFPIDIVKIDMALIQAAPDDRCYAEALVGLAQKTGRGVVAEGVETAEQAEWLQSLGVSAVQGWLYAKAEPAEALEERVLAEARW